MHTIRLIFVMKGYRYYAVLLSMVEVCIYLIGLNIVLDNIDRPINLLAYCVGFGTGIFLAAKSRMAGARLCDDASDRRFRIHGSAEYFAPERVWGNELDRRWAGRKEHGYASVGQT